MPNRKLPRAGGEGTCSPFFTHRTEPVWANFDKQNTDETKIAHRKGLSREVTYSPFFRHRTESMWANFDKQNSGRNTAIKQEELITILPCLLTISQMQQTPQFNRRHKVGNCRHYNQYRIEEIPNHINQAVSLKPKLVSAESRSHQSST